MILQTKLLNIMELPHLGGGGQHLHSLSGNRQTHINYCNFFANAHICLVRGTLTTTPSHEEEGDGTPD